MQAPTTPSGAPVRDPEPRACPGCGASNRQAAAFCWRCYRPLVVASDPAPPIYRPASLPRSISSPVALAPPRRSHPGVALVGAVAAVLLLAGAWFLLLGRSSGPELPESFAGVARISMPEIDAMIDQARDQIEALGGEGDVALYGGGAMEVVTLMWVGDPVPASPEDAFEAFASSTGATLPDGSSEVVDGVRYVCAPVQDGSANVCLWLKDEVLWLLAEVSAAPSLSGTLDLAVAAHDATA